MFLCKRANCEVLVLAKIDINCSIELFGWTLYCSMLVCGLSKRVASKTFHYLNDEEVVWILAFIGGFVDAAGYIKYNGLFTSSITGNLVVATASVYAPYGVVSRALVSVGFIVGGFLSVAISLRLKLASVWKHRSISIVLFTAEILIFVVIIALGMVYDDKINDNTSLSDWHLILIATITGLSMGVHNGAAKESIPNCPATTVMTMTLVAVSGLWSHVTSYFAARYLYYRLHPKDMNRPSEEQMKKLLQHLEEYFHKFIVAVKPLIAFLIGGLIGTVIMYHATFWCFFVPIGLLLIVNTDILIGRAVEEEVAKSSSSSSAAVVAVFQDKDIKDHKKEITTTTVIEKDIEQGYLLPNTSTVNGGYAMVSVSANAPTAAIEEEELATESEKERALPIDSTKMLLQA